MDFRGSKTIGLYYKVKNGLTEDRWISKTNGMTLPKTYLYSRARSISGQVNNAGNTG